MAVDFFLKIEGIPGESKVRGFEDQIDVLSFSWGMTQSGSYHLGGGGGSGKVDMQDLHFTKWMDKSSPELIKACCNGRAIPEVIFTGRKASGDNQHVYLKITLNDVIISSYQTSGSGSGNDIPLDSFSLNFAKQKTEYIEQNEDGSKGTTITAGWDIKKAEAA